METKYEVRLRRELPADDPIVQKAMSTFGAVSAQAVATLTFKLPSIQAVLDKLADIEEIKQCDVISIVLVDEANFDLLDCKKDIDWECE